MASSRRIPRSRRAVGATGLLISAVLVAVAGIIASTVPVLIGATTYAVGAGIVAARLLSNELAGRRREWALERSVIVADNRKVAVARSREHIAFAEQMGSRIRLRDAQLASLRESLVTAEIDLAKARERMSEERARSEALQDDVDSATTDLESSRLDLARALDALAESESVELDARAQLLALEEAVAQEPSRQHDRSA
jgi:chromosome segregation ATPase